jgi:4'-phosphopantetheinyl transferase
MNTAEYQTLSSSQVSPADVDVWVTQLQHCHDGQLLTRYVSLLSEEEFARWRRFVFEQDRHAYLVSHVLVRAILGQLLQAESGDLTFGEGPHGKPFLRHPLSSLGRLDFNLSHTNGITILCTALDRDVGVDVEYLGRSAPLDVAYHWFSELEVRELNQCLPGDRAERFWSLWTLKEAYLKAIGDGLSVPLDSFSFALNRPGALDFTTSVRGFAKASRWWFAQWSPSPTHIATLCLESRDARFPNVRFHEIIPLRSAYEIPFKFSRCGAHSEI